MSKFTKQYTTKEQSERVLKLGIPKWTADCYYLDLGLGDYSDKPKFGVGEEDSLPCWTTGRLIELLVICAIDEDHVRSIIADIANYAAPVETYVNVITYLCSKKELDFSKLERYE